MKKVFYALLAVVTAVSVLFSSHLYLGSNTAQNWDIRWEGEQMHAK